MDHEGINSPYVVGNEIKLQLKTPYGGQTTDARIIKVFEPFTLSSTMVERLASSSLDSPSTSCPSRYLVRELEGVLKGGPSEPVSRELRRTKKQRQGSQ